MKNNCILSASLAVCLTLAPVASQALETLLFGGGGEPMGDTTIFDGSLEKFADAKVRVGAKVTASFNGGHSTTSDIITKKIGVDYTPFTAANYTKMISDTVKRINSGEIKSGEQLMVVVDTHGGENDNQYGGKSLTHSISLTGHRIENMSNVSGSGTVSMDDMKALTEAAKAKGIKLAILDMSCHSGNSLKLANSNTCVIAGTGPQHFGYSTFTKSFYDQMQPGRSLEEVFLSARKNEIDHGFPMISTPSGVNLNENLYKLMTPYLNNRHGMNADKLTGSISRAAKAENTCERITDFDKLLKQVDAFEAVAGVAVNKYLGPVALRDELISYKEMQDEIISELVSLDYKLLDSKETISYKGVHPKTGKPVPMKISPMSVQDILNFPEGNLSYFEDQIPALKKQRRTRELYEMQQTIAEVKAIIDRQKELIATKPNLLKSRATLENISTMTDVIQEKALNVSQLSRKMYDHQYQELAKADKTPNPCKDFKF